MPPTVDNNHRPWSLIPETPQYLEKLELLCHTQKEIKREGYIVAQLDSGQIRGKSRCEKCGARFKASYVHDKKGKVQRGKGKGRGGKTVSHRKNDSKSSPHQAPGQSQHGHSKSKPSQDLLIDVDEPNQALNEAFPAISDLRKPLVEIEKTKSLAEQPAKGEASKKHPSKEQPSKEPKPVCFVHTKIVAHGRFLCCGKAPGAPGCTGMPEHVFLSANDPSLLSYWNFHPTLTHAHFPPHQAIALDCEMGVAHNMDTELIRLTAVDFFTGESLIDSLVCPSVKMKHYNTRYSGVSARDMNQAARSGRCIFGRDEARRRLLQFVGPETIVVTHGGNGDFSALRWIHGKVIDTFLLDSYFFGGREGGRSLKSLCLQILGVKVQQGRNGHDSLEDALACRELAHTWVMAIPD